MKRTLFFLLVALTSLSGVCQIRPDTIKICNDLELIKISENAFIHVSYANVTGYGRVPANGLIFTNNSDAFLFDTPWTDSLTMVLVTYLKDNLNLKIKGFVPNHWHNDCMGGLGYLQIEGIESYANQRTIDIARAKKLAFPVHGFVDSLQLKLGKKDIRCYYFGAAHSLDNIVVWIPSEKILFPGCMVKSLNSTDLGNISDGDLTAYPVTIEKVIKRFKTAEIVIPGHGQPGGFELLLHTRDLVRKQILKN
jgi:metallo-beta-lactamase class B